MPSSETDVVNSAFIKIGESTITSLDDTRKQAQIAARQYPLKRDELLRSYRWNFAVSRAQLAPEAEPPAFGFTHKFLQPTDSLRIISLFDEGQRPQNLTAGDETWKVEGRFILANAESVRVFYMRRVTNVLEFDPMFAETLSWALAVDLAYALTSGQSLVGATRAGFDRALRQARFSDAIEGTPEIFEASEWLDSRHQGVGSRGPRIGPVS